MIYQYEAKILEFINSVFPSINYMTYSPKEELITAMGQVVKQPSFFYYREGLVSDNHMYSLPKFNFFTQTYKYHGILIEETVEKSFAALKKLKFSWGQSYTVSPSKTISGVSESFPIDLRLFSLDIQDVWLPNDDKGPKRYLEIVWQSTIPIIDDTEIHIINARSFKIFLNSQSLISEIQDANAQIEAEQIPDTESLIFYQQLS